jgi:hypothetical protein
MATEQLILKYMNSKIKAGSIHKLKTKKRATNPD